jgi:hypothetical protein
MEPPVEWPRPATKTVPDMPGYAPPMPTTHRPRFGGRALVAALLKAGVPIGEHIQKVVIEADVRDAVRIYVRHIGDDRLLDVDWTGINFEIRQGEQKAPAASERVE